MNAFNSIAFRADRKSFSDALASAKRIVEKRNTIPILSNVLVDVRPDCVTLTVTDLDMALTIEMPADSQSTGGFTLDAHALADALKKMKGEFIRVTDLGGRAELVDEETGAKVTFNTLPAADFPELKAGDAKARFTLDQGALRSAYDVARAAMSKEETRYYLRGIFMHATADEFGRSVLRFAATDGHRLARVTMDCPMGADGMPDAIVPDKAVTFIHKQFGAKASGLVDITVNDAKVAFQFGRMRLITKTIDGTFPDYTRVIPSQNDVTLAFDADRLASTIETVTAVCSEKTRAVGLGMAPGQPLIVSARSPENGPAAAIVTAETGGAMGGTSTGWELGIGFNAQYLCQILATLGGTVEARLADAAAPTTFQSDSKPGVLWVLMPMRTDGVITNVAAVEKLNMNAFERLTAEAKERTAAVRRVLDNADIAKLSYKQRGDVYRAGHSEFARTIREAIAFLCGQVDRPIARAAVKVVLAQATGDAEAVARAMLVQHALQGGDKRSAEGWREESQDLATDLVQDPAKDLAIEPAAVEPEIEAEPVAVASAATETVECEPEPEDVPAAVEPTISETETVAVDQEPEAYDPEPVTKIETVYGQVMFVLTAHYENDSMVLIPRVDKNGVYMCEPESKGGARKRVHRDNIRRVILPRAKADQVRVRKAPADDTMAERVAELAATVASLQQTVASLQAGVVPAATVEAPQAGKERSPARLRLIRAYLSLRGQRVALQSECERLGDALEAANQAAASAETRLEGANAHLASLWRRRGCAKRMVRHALKLRAERATLRQERDDAVATAGRLTVRCDALERLQLASVTLDRREEQPAPAAKPSIILSSR